MGADRHPLLQTEAQAGRFALGYKRSLLRTSKPRAVKLLLMSRWMWPTPKGFVVPTLGILIESPRSQVLCDVVRLGAEALDFNVSSTCSTVGFPTTPAIAQLLPEHCPQNHPVLTRPVI